MPLTEDGLGVRITVAGMLAEGFTEKRRLSAYWFHYLGIATYSLTSQVLKVKFP